MVETATDDVATDAEVFVPFFEDCAAELGPQAAEFERVVSLCGGSPGAGENGGAHGTASGNWHGGQWLIPEIQTDATGIVCNWATNPELRYINAALAALESHGAAGGGRLFDLDTLFFTGCSMGSALTVWLAQCMQ